MKQPKDMTGSELTEAYADHYRSPMAVEKKPYESKHDPVQHPLHYTLGEIECIDAIKSALTPEEWRGFCKGSVLSYIWRERYKGKDQDVKKAGWYIERLLAEEKEAA